MDVVYSRIICRYKGDCSKCYSLEECKEAAWKYLGGRSHKNDVRTLEQEGHEEFLLSQYLVRDYIEVSKTVAELVYEAHQQAGYFRPVVVKARRLQRKRERARARKEARALNNTRVLKRGSKAIVIRGRTRLDAKIKVSGDYVVVEPIENGNAAYVVNKKDYSHTIDLSKVDHIRVVHNHGGIEFLKSLCG